MNFLEPFKAKFAQVAHYLAPMVPSPRKGGDSLEFSARFVGSKSQPLATFPRPVFGDVPQRVTHGCPNLDGVGRLDG